MSDNTQAVPVEARRVETVAVIGTGVIGASWASNFLAAGLTVRATDPADGAENRLRAAIAAHWPALCEIGLADGADPARLTFHATAEEAADGADFVQENGPERADMKRTLFAALDEAAPDHAILATSTSTIMVSEFQDACAKGPERVVLGHPFNPPHLIPLVEVGGGKATAPDAVARAIAFYRAIGKHPIHLKREARGHVSNRLQIALWKEAFHIVQSGIASVEDVDAAIAHGPGLRWALLGPFLNIHLSGGAGGIRGLLEGPLGAATTGMFPELETPTVDAALIDALAAGVDEELATRDTAAMMEARNRLLIRLVRDKKAATDLP
ncbi:3-hydroxyacyl-CoA dehydrogenase NAD-binding domain-containing protein [Acuticoccus yangtzensis]|uniref:3-hydroxyacyl-CoA dehydrogenase NAD-binding domain-containing protein n=1 Tax=Acuticoccus yangtzensis TaxID=1443441 RepID=UPI0009494F54|nr:3-hydroxyacyl-CoA dehydrogenase NAD-binding domain-containing protein [Acuticoccus yangtzensis]